MESGRVIMTVEIGKMVQQMVDEQRASYARIIAKTTREMYKRAELAERLSTIGIEVNASNIRWGYHEIPIDEKQLPKLRTVFSQVKLSNEKEVHDADKKLVQVFLDVGEDTCGIKFYVVRKLPKDAKCKIRTETTRSKVLVCELS